MTPKAFDDLVREADEQPFTGWDFAYLHSIHEHIRAHGRLVFASHRFYIEARKAKTPSMQ